MPIFMLMKHNRCRGSAMIFIAIFCWTHCYDIKFIIVSTTAANFCAHHTLSWSYAGTSVEIALSFAVLYGYPHQITTTWWFFWKNWLPCCVISNSFKFRWDLTIHLTWNRIFLFNNLQKCRWCWCKFFSFS